MAGGALCAFLLSLAVIYLPGVSLSLMYMIVIAFGFFSSTYALSFAVASTYVPPSSKGVTMGFINMLCILFGAPLYQPLIGYILKETADVETMQKIRLYTPDEFSVALSVLPLSLFIAFVLSLFIKDKNRRDLPQDGA